MLVTSNGVMWSVEEQNDLWIADLIAAFDAADTVDDDAADHALDTICFLQDSDIDTPMDEFPDMPMSLTFTDLELR
jgi:hypothetical protein